MLKNLSQKIQRSTMIRNRNSIVMIRVFVGALIAVSALQMPPLDLTASRHTSDYTTKKNHPTSYEESPKFLGPISLPNTISTSENRMRIKNYYENILNVKTIPSQPLSPENSRTDKILKTIVDHFAYHDAPVDVKEIAESMEFYLRTRKRMFGAAAKRRIRNERIAGELNFLDEPRFRNQITIYDLCSGHGLTGMLYAACNPPKNGQLIKVVLVDLVKPPAHQVLLDLISQVCPWVQDSFLVQFRADSLHNITFNCDVADDDQINIVISVHACGSLTDSILHKACNELNACAIASMPCCYTGTDKGVPYGIKRALGVAWCADIRRSLFLEENGYHTDFATIPRQITPLNRIILAEVRS